MSAEPDERLAANRANWDERTGIHVGSRFYDVDGWLLEGRGPRPHEAAVLGDVRGLRLLHLQCHFGLDTLAWARVGADVTGLDFSSEAITAARDLAERAGLPGSFVCADVLDAAAALDGATFDVVYVSLGALTWLPSVDRWASQVAALLAPGGRLYLHDVHPVAWALADENLRWEQTYFEELEPFVWDSGETYANDDGTPIGSTRTYEWNHSIGEVVTAVLRHGLRLDLLVEHDWTSYPRFPWLVRASDQVWRTPPGRPRVPLSFTLLATRLDRAATVTT